MAKRPEKDTLKIKGILEGEQQLIVWSFAFYF